MGPEDRCEQSKLAKFANSLRRLEREAGASDDLADLRRQFVASVGQWSSSRFRLGRELCSYRAALPHGKWGPFEAETARNLTISRRTLREIVASYKIVRHAPPLVIQEFDDRGLDPAATKNLELVRGTTQGWRAGLPPAQAFEQAKAQAPVHEPPSITREPMTDDERWVLGERVAMRKGIEHIPDNRKADILMASLAEELWLLGLPGEPITIVPTRPTIDLSGRRAR
jgi:hypothetical protein